MRSTTPPLPTVPTPLPRLPQFVEASLSCGGGAGAGAGRPVEMVPTHAVVMGVGHGRAHALLCLPNYCWRTNDLAQLPLR